MLNITHWIAISGKLVKVLLFLDSFFFQLVYDFLQHAD